MISRILSLAVLAFSLSQGPVAVAKDASACLCCDDCVHCDCPDCPGCPDC